MGGAGDALAVQHAGQRRACQRGRDEHPQIDERLAADKQRRPEGPRRIDRNPGHIDADQVDRRQRQPDSQPGKTGRRIGLRRPEDDRDEEEGRDELENQCGGQPVFPR